jgi:hypothetical protein
VHLSRSVSFDDQPAALEADGVRSMIGNGHGTPVPGPEAPIRLARDPFSGPLAATSWPSGQTQQFPDERLSTSYWSVCVKEALAAHEYAQPDTTVQPCRRCRAEQPGYVEDAER